MIRKNIPPFFFLLTFSTLLGLFIGNILDIPITESAIISLSIYLISKTINNLGKTVWVFLDVISLILVLTCLVMPLFFYHHFTDTSALAVLWVKYMPVPAEIYYNFALPATLALILGFNCPIISRLEFKYTIKEYIILSGLSRSSIVGFQFIIISLLASTFRSFLPSSLNFVLFLSIKLIFVGFLYLYFSGKKPNVKWLIIAGGLLFFQSLQAAMFGELIFMTLLAIIVFTYGNNYSIFLKTSVIAFGIMSIVIIQSIKHEYRQSVWGDNERNSGSNITLFLNLAGKKTLDNNNFFTEDKLFFTAVRFNQGWLVASVMKNVPNVVPYAEGETIWRSLLASVVPRFLWPDKPEAGGKANIKRFLGWDLRGTSMNIGLLGEGYANFGVYGGCVFLFFYGLAFQWAYNFVIRITHNYPTVILWMPLLFFYCIGVENDVLTVVNHFMKTGFFIYLVYKIYPKIFKVNL